MKHLISFLKKLRNLYLAKIVWGNYVIGSNFHAARGVFIWGKKGVEIGNNFYIGKYSIIECTAKIGHNVMFGNRVALIGKYDHNFQQVGKAIRMASSIRDADYNWHGLNQVITIEDDVWVGYGSTIMGGVTIGTGSIVAAGSVVTHDVAPYTIVAGVPAKKLKDRFGSADDLQRHISLYRK